MKHAFLYAVLPFLPLLALLGTADVDRAAPTDGKSPPAAVRICGTFNGRACSPEGFEFVCYNHFPDEPGLCACTGGIWDCG